jgi:hypothetical protein
MAEFTIEAGDYERYGLDDPRCNALRPTGTVRLIREPDGWLIEAEGRWWSFARQPFVRKLHDRYRLSFYSEERWCTSLWLLAPFEAFSRGETEVLESLAEGKRPKNAPGDFYAVTSDCICIGACAPVEVAPDLMGYQEEPEGCYFARQPQTDEEVGRAIDAVLAAFVDNLRYGGSDPTILGRIRAATRNMTLDFCQDDLCDHPTPEGDRCSRGAVTPEGNLRLRCRSTNLMTAQDRHRWHVRWFLLKRIGWCLAGQAVCLAAIGAVFLLPVTAVAFLLGVSWAAWVLAALVVLSCGLLKAPDVLERSWEALQASCPVSVELEAERREQEER